MGSWGLSSLGRRSIRSTSRPSMVTNSAWLDTWGRLVRHRPCAPCPSQNPCRPTAFGRGSRLSVMSIRSCSDREDVVSGSMVAFRFGDIVCNHDCLSLRIRTTSRLHELTCLRSTSTSFTRGAYVSRLCECTRAQYILSSIMYC